VRLSPRAYQQVTLFALLALCVIIVSGGAVRLTGSGLGCPDWPNCDSTTPVAELGYHAWVEYGNRLFTGLVSIAVILAVLGALIREPRRRDLTWLSVGLVAGVVAQIVLGALVVATDLVPAAVSAHFLVSMVLVWDAVVLHHRAGRDEGRTELVVPVAIRNLARAMLAVGVVVLFTGTLVTGAGPHSGDPGEVERLSYEVRDLARVHGVAVVTLVVLGLITVYSVFRAHAPSGTRTRGLCLVGALLVQGGIGYTQYFTGVPVLLVGAHVLGAVVVWVALLEFYLGLFAATEGVASDPSSERTQRDALVGI
jgi:cytochrome c oxidase assembly protein subunit 15